MRWKPIKDIFTKWNSITVNPSNCWMNGWSTVTCEKYDSMHICVWAGWVVCEHRCVFDLRTSKSHAMQFISGKKSPSENKNKEYPNKMMNSCIPWLLSLYHSVSFFAIFNGVCVRQQGFSWCVLYHKDSYYRYIIHYLMLSWLDVNRDTRKHSTHIRAGLVHLPQGGEFISSHSIGRFASKFVFTEENNPLYDTLKTEKFESNKNPIFFGKPDWFFLHNKMP